MDTLDQLRNRRSMSPEEHLRGIWVCKVSSKSSAKKKKCHGHLGSVEKLKAHGFGRTAQGRMGSEGQLRGIEVRKVSSSAKKKYHGHLGSVEKLKTHGSGRTAQGYWGPQRYFKCKRQKQKKK
ncbi:hypothetical protein L3X38_038061 [Prunus dulcis]|uniref:Uncharacterized protein n=1 Tax=Prunus dulcis TaxID=3755 RepID=A0AAD4YRT6_PRUDU|nr:hypothetical protein L3X38_038061 [Prunus dulcis]